MRTLKIFEHISLDGVIQLSPDDNGFPYTDWTAPYRTPAGRDEVVAAQGTRFDLLLGRRTYDLWSSYWPKAPSGPIADPFNAATKYVATHHPDSLTWGPAVALGGNIVERVAQLKSEAGADLILWGSSTLTSLLLEHGVVDELMLITYPVLIGTGKRLVDGAPARTLELVTTKALPSGIVFNRYKVGDCLLRA
jgi:dihydrofolate reductase